MMDSNELTFENVPNDTKVEEFYQKTESDSVSMRFGYVMGKSTNSIIIKYSSEDYEKYDIHTGKHQKNSTYIKICKK